MATTALTTAGIRSLRDLYRDGLLEDTVPFWIQHGVDRKCGGFATYVDADGSRVSWDKAVWVQGRFTISSAGSVKDAVAVQSSHSLFERNAVQAVNKWKYQPQLRGGQPTEAPGQQVIVRFRMEG